MLADFADMAKTFINEKVTNPAIYTKMIINGALRSAYNIGRQEGKTFVAHFTPSYVFDGHPLVNFFEVTGDGNIKYQKTIIISADAISGKIGESVKSLASMANLKIEDIMEKTILGLNESLRNSMKEHGGTFAVIVLDNPNPEQLRATICDQSGGEIIKIPVAELLKL